MRLPDFLVRMWRLCECERLKPPLPVLAKRLAAPLMVFSLGMGYSFHRYCRVHVLKPLRSWPGLAKNSPGLSLFLSSPRRRGSNFLVRKPDSRLRGNDKPTI